MKLIKPTILFTILFSLFFTNISHAEVSEKNYLVSKTDAEKKYEQLGIKAASKNLKAPSSIYISELKKLVMSYGIDVVKY